jgi:hypothetical protein
MNRRSVGSSIGSSGEGVWALSCSLLETFTPSDEPTPSRLYTISSSGAEEIFLSPQTRVQLLRRVIKTGRRTIRCLVSPRSSVAPTVRPTLLFFHRRFTRRPTEAWVLLVIFVGVCFVSIPNFSRPPRPRPYATSLSASGELTRARASSEAIRARRRPPLCLISCARHSNP